MPVFHNLPNVAHEKYDDAKTAEHAVSMWMQREHASDKRHDSRENKKANQQPLSGHLRRLSNSKRVVMTDIDGILTQYAGDPEKSFAATNALLFGSSGTLAEAVPREGAADMLNAYAQKGYEIVYYCARPEGLRRQTLQWLRTHAFPTPARLFMSNVDIEVPLAAGMDPERAATVMATYWIENSEQTIKEWVENEIEGRVAYAYGDATFEIKANLEAGVEIGAVRICVVPLCDSADTVPRQSGDEPFKAVHYASSWNAWRDTYVAAAPRADALR
jgi:hypothetical protein